MDNVDQFFQNSHYNISRILLSISGLWPFHTKSRRYPMYLAMILVLGSGFTFQILGAMEVRHDSFELVDCFPLLGYALVVICRTISAVCTLPKIKLLLLKMQEYCLSSKSNEEYKIYNSHVLYGRKLGYTYTCLMFGDSIFYNTAALLTRLMSTESVKNNTSNQVQNAQVGIPYRVNYMVDVDTYYVPIFIHTATCNVTYVILLITLDVLYITLVQHCRGLFAAFRYRLENSFVIEDDSYSLMETYSKDNSYLNVAYSARRHAETIQFVKIMNTVFSPALFVHVGCTILILSILGYQVIMNTEDINRLVKPATYFTGLMCNIFFENWLGQRIINSSEMVFESAYNAEWYNMSIATRKLLIMIMMRSMKPLVLTAGKFMILSYITFSAVMRTSSSYFMLLRSVS